MFSFSVPSRRTIDYRKEKNVDDKTCFNCHELDPVAINYLKSKKQIVQIKNLNLIFVDDLDSVHIINESDSNYVNSNINFNFERKK